MARRGRARPSSCRCRGSGRRTGCAGRRGRYACYSLAWSPYAAGKLIRGGLVIGPGRGRALSATYSETVFDKTIRLAGTPAVADRTLHLHLLEPGGEMPLFFNLFLPRPPAGVLCGMLSGVTFLGREPEPSASRIAAVRVPEEATLDGSNRYLEPDPGDLAGDLAELGLALPEPRRVGRLLRDFLTGGGRPNQVPAAQQAALAAELDPLHLAGAVAV